MKARMTNVRERIIQVRENDYYIWEWWMYGIMTNENREWQRYEQMPNVRVTRSDKWINNHVARGKESVSTHKELREGRRKTGGSEGRRKEWGQKGRRGENWSGGEREGGRNITWAREWVRGGD